MVEGLDAGVAGIDGLLLRDLVHKLGHALQTTIAVERLLREIRIPV